MSEHNIKQDTEKTEAIAKVNHYNTQKKSFLGGSLLLEVFESVYQNKQTVYRNY